MPAQIARIVGIGLYGKHSSSAFGRKQSVDADVGTHIQHDCPFPNGRAKNLSFLFFEKARRMPNIYADRVTDIYIKLQAPVEIVDTVSRSIGKDPPIDAEQFAQTSKCGEVLSRASNAEWKGCTHRQ